MKALGACRRGSDQMVGGVVPDFRNTHIVSHSIGEASATAEIVLSRSGTKCVNLSSLRLKNPPRTGFRGDDGTVPVRLTRTVRITVNPLSSRENAVGSARHNTFASWPAPKGIATWYEFDVVLEGEPDRETGYLMGIDVVDRVVRERTLPLLEQAFDDGNRMPAPALLFLIAAGLEEGLGSMFRQLAWRITPRHQITWSSTQKEASSDAREIMSTNTERHVLIRDRFEFSASHRLHCPDQSDEWNRETFGKCNNPNGHGHNYELEVAVDCPVDANGLPALPIEQLECIVEEHVISKLDHRHLNDDCPEFANLNPSVENITVTCHGMLQEAISRAGARLATTTVWETGKTSCTYPVSGA